MSSDGFKLACKVPDHDGPLAEGFEANSQYKNSINRERRTNPTVKNGELDPLEFGVWHSFATCLKNALFLMEGQAYFKEVGIVDKRKANAQTNAKPIVDNGSGKGRVMANDSILAGGIVGSSKFATQKASAFFDFMWDKDERRTFHGAGLRYNEKEDGSDAIVLHCLKFLPQHVQNDAQLQPMSIKPNFDMEMNLLGWYDSRDNSGGTLQELLVKGTKPNGEFVYEDDRPLQKYYRQHKGKYLTAFKPEY